MDTRDSHLLPSPKGPRFQVVESWPTYGSRDEFESIRRCVVATAYTYGFALWLAERARQQCGGGDVEFEVRDLRPVPAPPFVPADPHPASCLCAECQELPF
jgi:hypothetical protein